MSKLTKNYYLILMLQEFQKALSLLIEWKSKLIDKISQLQNQKWIATLLNQICELEQKIKEYTEAKNTKNLETKKNH